MDRPYIKGLILSSIDSRIDGDFFSLESTRESASYFAKLRNETEYDALLNGAVTATEIYAKGYRRNHGSKVKDPQDNIVLSENKYVVCIDPEGSLNWENDSVKRGDDEYKVIEVLSEEAGQDYVDDLKRLNIAYIFAGKKKIDLKLLMKKLKDVFTINNVLVTGGGAMNYSLLADRLLDEINIIVAPVISGEKDVATIFDRTVFNDVSQSADMKLSEIKKLDENTILLAYRLN